MPKIKIENLRKKMTVVSNGKRHVVTSIAWDKENDRITIIGTNGLATSVNFGTYINIE